MTVRILTEDQEDLQELAQEYPKEASIIEAMLNDAEPADDEGDEQRNEDA